MSQPARTLTFDVFTSPKFVEATVAEPRALYPNGAAVYYGSSQIGLTTSTGTLLTSGQVFTSDVYLVAAGRATVDDTPSPVSAGSGSGSGLPSTVQSKTTTYTAAAGDFVKADTTSGGFTVTLPTDPEVGRLVAVKKISNDANVLTVAAGGGGTIDGSSTTTTATQWAGLVLEHAGSNVWHVAASMSTTGPQGPTGATGPTGPTGPAGPSGSGGQIGYPIALATGRYGVITSTSFGGPQAVTQGEMLAFPVYFNKDATLTALGVHCWAAGSAGASVRMGLYASDATGNLPNTVLASGTAAATSTGLLTVAISQAVTKGALYWVAFVSQGAPTTAPTFLCVKQEAVVPGVTVSAAEAAQSTQTGYSVTGVTAALPSSWGSPTRSAVTDRPRIFIGS